VPIYRPAPASFCRAGPGRGHVGHGPNQCPV